MIGGSQFVELNGVVPSSATISSGFAKSWILGSWLSLLYATDMSAVVENELHLYANDSASFVYGNSDIEKKAKQRL